MSYKKSAYIVKAFNKDGELIIKNTLTQKILKAHPEHISDVENALNRSYEGVEILEGIPEKLYQNGFIIEGNVDEDLIVDYTFNQYSYGSNILELTVLPTNACNFDCVYCYQKEPYFCMTDHTVDNLIKFIEKHINEYSGLLISWFGGEPLLAKKIIIQVMDRVRDICRKNKKPFYSSITTNGYELDLSTFESLVANHVRFFQITVDGPKDIHNRQRPHKTKPDSFETIMRNLTDIKRTMTKHRFIIAVRVNVSSALRSYLNEFIEFLYTQFGNDKHFTIVWEFIRDWGGDKIENNKDLMMDHKLSNQWLDTLSNKGFEINKGFARNNISESLCTASKKNGFVINHDGGVYKCAMVVENEEMKAINRIGYITSDGDMSLDLSKMVKWLGRDPVDKECVKCQHYPECMGVSCPLSTRILKNPKHCSETFIDDYEMILRNVDAINNIEYVV
jgi:hypothetical protein